MPMHNPPHIGEFLWSEIIAPHGLSITAASDVLRVSRPTLSSLVNGRSALSGEMALRIEKAFGIRMDTLLAMQNAYDIAKARKGERKIKVKRYVAKELAPA